MRLLFNANPPSWAHRRRRSGVERWVSQDAVMPHPAIDEAPGVLATFAEGRRSADRWAAISRA
jgi:hypothetical protein